MPLSGDGRKLFNQARDFQRSKDYDTAIKIYNRILDNTEDAGVYQQLGDIFERTSETNKAIDAFRRSANLYMEEQLWREALGVYRRLSRVMKEDRDDLGWELASLYIKMNMEIEAIRDLTLYGNKKMKENNLPEAFRAFDKIMELEPQNIVIRAKYANILGQKGQYSKAIKNYQIVKEIYNKKGDNEKANEIDLMIKEMENNVSQTHSPQESKTGEEPDFGFMIGEFVSQEDQSKQTEASTYKSGFILDEKKEIKEEPTSTVHQYVESGISETEELGDIPSLGKIGIGSEDDGIIRKAFAEKEKITDEEAALSLFKDDVEPVKKKIIQKKKKEKDVTGQLQKGEVFESLNLDDLLKNLSEEKEEVEDLFSFEEAARKDIKEKVTKRGDSSASMSSLKEPLSIDSLLQGEGENWSNVATELAKELVEDKKINQIKKEQDKILTDGTPWDEFEEQSQLLLSVGETEEAIDYLYQAADGFYDDNILDKAWSLYNQIVDLRPFEIRPRQKMVQIALKLEDTDKVTLAYLSLYDCQKRRGAFIDAEETLNKLKNISPSHPGVIARDNPQLDKKNKKHQAVDLSTLLEVETLQEVLGTNDMTSLVDEFKEEVYQSISSSDRENYDAHYELGITFKEMGLYDEAIEEFNIATKSKKSYLKSMEMIANCLSDLGKKDAAVTQLEAILQGKGHKEEEMVGIRYLLGTLYEEKGENKKAKKQYTIVYKIYPDFADVRKKIK